MTKLPLIITLISALGPVSAGSLSKCIAPDGSVTYSDRGCPKAAAEQNVDIEVSESGSGLRPGEQEMLDRIRAEEAEQQRRKTYARERDERTHIGYSDRLRLKELRSDRDRLVRESQRGGLTYSESRVIREQIRAIDAEMSRIQSPKW